MLGLVCYRLIRSAAMLVIAIHLNLLCLEYGGRQLNGFLMTIK
jgi:hypothetical protein